MKLREILYILYKRGNAMTELDPIIANLSIGQAETKIKEWVIEALPERATPIDSTVYDEMKHEGRNEYREEVIRRLNENSR